MQKLRELNKGKHIYNVQMFKTFLESMELELFPIIFPIPLFSQFPNFPGAKVLVVHF